MDLEAKLLEIQARNKRMARMAMRTQERGPARFVLYDSDESEEDLYEARRHKQLPKGLTRKQIGKPYRQGARLKPAGAWQAEGYAPDAAPTDREDDEGNLSAEGFQEYLPQDRRRLREIAALRKARLRGTVHTHIHIHTHTHVHDILICIHIYRYT